MDKEPEQKKEKTPKPRVEKVEPEISSEIAQVPAETTHIKRMVAALDKFLNRRIAGLVMFYVCALIVSCTFVIMNGTTTSATTGERGWRSTSNALLYSFVAVLTFIFILIVVRVISIRRGKNKNEKIEPVV